LNPHVESSIQHKGKNDTLMLEEYVYNHIPVEFGACV